MKKILPIIAMALTIVSCSKYADQTDAVKDDLKATHNISDKEISEYKIETSELLGKDAHDLVYKFCGKDFEAY